MLVRDRDIVCVHFQEQYRFCYDLALEFIESS